MTQPWTDLEDDDLWLLQPDELALLPGSSNDKGRLGFALQLKLGAFKQTTSKSHRILRYSTASKGLSRILTAQF